jgi:organic hydroperoxide reductase OsmC/OhrA
MQFPDPEIYWMTNEHVVKLSLDAGYAFTVDWDDPTLAPLKVDEPPPLGSGDGPNAVKLLGAAIAECLASSFLFCAHKARIEVVDMRAVARLRIERGNGGRLRVDHVHVDLAPQFADPAAKYERCLALFEDYCTVTASVRAAIDVTVHVNGVPTRETLAAANADDVALACVG